MVADGIGSVIFAAMRLIDLNADLGEGGKEDATLLGLVTSANIACGGHAGDERTMRHAIELALEGLYLARRISKESDEGQTIYG